MSEILRKLTLKRLMLILMSTLLVLVVVMATIVIGEVKDMLAAFSGEGGKDPSTSLGTTQEPSTTTNTEPSNTEESSEATTAPTTPTETDPVETTESHVHEYVKDKTTAATCTSMGYTVYKCSCGKTDVRDFREQLGHQYQETKVEQTCEQDGCTMKSCVRCGDVQRTDIQPALGHDYQLVKTVAVTCEQEGYDEMQCTHCQAVKKENVKPALNHTYGEWETVKEATDSAPGERKHTCATCQKEEKDVLPATGEFKINSSAMSNEDENWTYYRLQVGTKTTPYAYTFGIYIGLENRSVTYKYSKDTGLTVTYTAPDGTQLQQTLAPYADGVLTIDKDGKVSSVVPTVKPGPEEPTTDPTESTAPSESTASSESTDPTEPSAVTEPTGSEDPTTPGEPNT